MSDVAADTPEDQFAAGARAMFDALLFRAANNWHANQEINKACTKDNSIVTSWAVDALKEVSPEDYETWLSIELAFERGFAAGKQSK